MLLSPNLRFIFSELTRQRKLLVYSVLLMIAGAAIEPVIPALMKPLLDETIPNRNEATSFVTPLLILLAFLFKGIIEYVSSITAQRMSQLAVHRIRSELFRSICHLPFDIVRRADPGFYASKMLNDVGSISGAISTVWVTLVKDSLIILFLLTYLLYMSWILTLIILFSLPLVSYIVYRSSVRIRLSSKSLQDHSANLNSALVDYFSSAGLRDIFTMGIKTFAQQRVGKLSENLALESITLARRQALVVPLVQLVAAVGVTAAVSLALWLPLGLNTAGDFVSFMAALAMLFEPLKRLTNLNTVIQKGLVGVESVRTIVEAARGSHTWQRSDEVSSEGPPLKIFLDMKEKLIGEAKLEGCRLSLQQGEFVGLRGVSGSGKSTIAFIMAGLDTDFVGHLDMLRENGPSTFAGEALEGPVCHRRMSESSSPGLIYLGPQPMIFSDTVLHNVSFGMDESDGFVDTRMALKRSQLSHLADHIEQPIGCGGRVLSAGEAQRLAFARVHFFKPAFVILDEATGSMDEETELMILSELRRAFPNIGGLIISHRESAYRFVEKVLHLENGLLSAR